MTRKSSLSSVSDKTASITKAKAVKKASSTVKKTSTKTSATAKKTATKTASKATKKPPLLAPDSGSYDFTSYPLEHISGITDNNIDKFKEKLKLHNLGDLLMFLPRNYEDRGRLYLLNEVILGNKVMVRLQIQKRFLKLHGNRGARRNNDSAVFSCIDEEGQLCDVYFYNAVNYFNKSLEDGGVYTFYGQVKIGFGMNSQGFMMVHPEVISEDDSKKLLENKTLTPIYPTTKGLKQNTIRKVVSNALELAIKLGFDELKPQRGFPPIYLQGVNWGERETGGGIDLNNLNLLDSLKILHNPPLGMKAQEIRNGQSPWLVRVTAEEILAKQLSLLKAKHAYRSQTAVTIPLENNALTKAIIQSLPYTLTKAQQKALAQVMRDLASGKPMLRLIQGDVGCGKTMVALLACAHVVENGYQVILMAPTEILAAQLYQNMEDALGPQGVKVVQVNGRLTSRQKREVAAQVKSGEAQVIVGTHAVYSDWLEYHNLALAIVDEQHRFGVEQRLLTQKKQENFQVHFMMMSATPAPRSIAMTMFADLDLTIIDELPPGRKPVHTSMLSMHRREALIERVRLKIEKEQAQVYWVCMLIDENDNYSADSVAETIEILQQRLPQARIGIIHGRMKDEEKAEVMMAFKNHQLDLIVATTVIEVGVNVPNASIMIIQNPEHLGLSQIHQLRGRVGRGDKESFCILLHGASVGQSVKDRLNIFTLTNDGFEIAEADMKKRGIGDIVGTAQSGSMDFMIADLVRDAEIANALAPLSEKLLEEEPELAQKLIDRWVRDKQHLIGA